MMGLRARVSLLAVLAAGLGGPRATRAQDRPFSELAAAARHRYAREPSLGRIVDAGVAAAAVAPERARDLARAARLSGWLPDLRIGASRGLARDLSLLQTGDTGRTTVGSDEDFGVEAAVTFRLDRLVFAPESVALLREERALRLARAEIVRVIVRLYFERRRLQIERDFLGSDDLDHGMRIAEIEGLLDGFTGGAFSRMMGAPPRPRAGP